MDDAAVGAVGYRLADDHFAYGFCGGNHSDSGLADVVPPSYPMETTSLDGRGWVGQYGIDLVCVETAKTGDAHDRATCTIQLQSAARVWPGGDTDVASKAANRLGAWNL